MELFEEPKAKTRSNRGCGLRVIPGLKLVDFITVALKFLFDYNTNILHAFFL